MAITELNSQCSIYHTLLRPSKELHMHESVSSVDADDLLEGGIVSNSCSEDRITSTLNKSLLNEKQLQTAELSYQQPPSSLLKYLCF